MDQGWHVELGVPAEELVGKLAVFREVFPGARTVMFGFGKKTFMTAPPQTPGEYVLGPVPGPAVIEVFGISVPVADAYGSEDIVALSLPPGGGAALSAFLWDELESDAGKPRLVARGRFPGSLFYAARRGYSLAHTCNTWVADALGAAGLPVTGDGVIFSGQVMARATAAAGQCRPVSRPAPS